MTTSVHTNSSALIALQNLNRTNDRLGDVQNRVSTGLKVQGARDNAAIWAVAEGQRADMKALESVTNSLNRAASVADVSLAAGEQIVELIGQLRQHATAAADPSISAASRAAYNNDFQALLQSITSFADNAAFDGSNILNNSLTADLAFLANSDATETIDLSRQNMTLAGLGLGGTVDLTTATNAAAALGLVETALATATSRMAALGAESKRIDQHLVFISKLSDSLETGVGQLVDADLAKESARLQALQVQQQLGAQALSIANSAPQIVLSLFRSS
ncbi:MAG TPA: flagellin [Brevundimonas sp.]|jgi:flagellin|uniref:flagellin n=1 Tax=Brevundimonas sp. TaxID=1871086 RepID=UPI002B7ACD07|nr:flagellin [Brevundimonas sp.]HRH21502.1 flagellin [Brevundimonas sp.]